MEKIDLDKLEENALFHFTKTENLNSIAEHGLIPQIGENSHRVENTSKVFFSKGEIGVLKATEVWLRGLMNKINGANDKLGKYKNLSSKEEAQKLREWNEKFLNREYLNDEEKKSELFEYYYDYLQERTFLILDLEEKKHYLIDDVDENKKNLLLNPNAVKTAYAKEMYGSFSNMDSEIVDDWNMHTITDVPVEVENILELTFNDESADALTIVMEIYNKYKGLNKEKLLIDDFIDYANKRKMKEEGNRVNDKDNLCGKNKRNLF